MTNLSFENLIFQDGVISLSKAVILCSMIDNDHDDALVKYLGENGVHAVITRAGGSGDNLKSKLLRNTFGAAENSGLISINLKNRHAITKIVEEVLRSFDSPLINVAGGGLKIGLAVKGNDMAMSIFGSLGIPGLNVDYEVSASRILYHCLEN